MRSRPPIPNRVRFAFALPAFALLAFGCVEDAAGPALTDPGVADQVRRLSSVLDYIAADYPGCVADGAITNQLEYDEQIAFIKDARDLASQLPPPPTPVDVGQGLDQLEAAITRIADANEVASLARGLSKQLVAAYGVVLAPAAAPSFERGQSIYQTHCATCHGQTGAADTPLARTLEPPPRSFLDSEIMGGMSPARAFNTVTDGIAETSMQSFGALSPSERWSVAYFVFTLRQEQSAAERGAEVMARLDGAIVATPSRLAGWTDDELLAILAQAGLDDADSRDALAHLRRTAPYRASGTPMDRAREHLAAAVSAYRDGDAQAARQQAADAYLDGFEPHEAALDARDHDMMVRLEGEFLGLRNAMASGAPVSEVEQRALRLGALLDRVDELLGTGGGARVAFVSSLLVIVREGLEGALLILLLLGIARRSGASASDRRAVHYGWIGAIGLGVITWFLSGVLIGAIGGASRELVEGIISLLAAVVLLTVSHFVLARLDAKRRVLALKERVAAAVSTPRRRLVLASLAFVAVYREMFESVLFLRAIMLDANASGTAVLGGVLAGGVLLIGLVWGMQRLGNRLRPGPLLTAMGTMLCLLAVVLAGKGVRSLQEAGWIDISPITGPRLDWVGLYPTVQTVAAQILVLVAFAALVGWAGWKNRVQHDVDTAPAS